MKMARVAAASSLLLLVAACGGGTEQAAAPADSRTDSAYAAMQERGASPEAMGVDQYTSAHQFEPLPDGGRIELQREVEDSAGVQQIRTHLTHIAAAFAQGDFRIPAFVHDRTEVPGTEVMRARREFIAYEFQPLPRGGELRMRSRDPEAIEAIHAFLAFQRSDHREQMHGSH